MDHIAGFGNKMTEIIKFLKIMILFIFLFLIVTEVSGKPFLNPLESFCLSYTKYFLLKVILFSKFYFTESMTPCKVDSDCPLDLCQRPDVAKCLFYTCFCQNENMILI